MPRSLARWAVVLALPLLASPLAAAAAVFQVNTTRDGVDATPGDGTCDTGTSAQPVCSLRAAIQEANTTDTLDEIDLPNGTFTLSLGGAGEDAALTGDLDVTTPIGIVGQGFQFTLIDGKGAKDRIFDVQAGGTLTLSQLTLQNAKTAKLDSDPGFPGELSGGCVRSAGTLALDRVFFFRCSSGDDGGCLGVIGGSVVGGGDIFSACKSKDEGGAVEIRAPGSATFLRGTWVGGKAGTGGAIATRGALTLRNTTLAANKARLGGGVAVLGSGTATINSSTLDSNGPVDLDASQTSGAVTVSNTILSGAKAACAGAITSAGGNLADDASCALGGPNDQQGLDPKLLPLSFYGNVLVVLVPTFGLDAASPAIDHGLDASCETTDARNVARVDVTNVGVAVCDSGSFEFQPQP